MLTVYYQTGNTILLPANVGDVTGMVTQAMTIYQKLNAQSLGKFYCYQILHFRISTEYRLA